CSGKIIQRRSKKRRSFYACTNPECKYILWSKPLKERCPKCNYFLIYSKKAKKLIKKCSNLTCDFTIEEGKDEETGNGNGNGSSNGVNE
ncbi:MAG: topoisomerase DNA-binding C4 zinc finger domain-containing protein, partial [bacterium]|nr:topoisomerase DNA-binding C4 zinc finger domain-containing protein [bacterium]